MNKCIAVTLGLMSLSGCTIYSYDTVEEPAVVYTEPGVYNYAPIVLDASATVELLLGTSRMGSGFATASVTHRTTCTPLILWMPRSPRHFASWC